MSAFRRAQHRLTPDAARRQGEITRLAMIVLGREGGIRFMNTENASLGGRPIDLAIASEEGRALVEGELGKTTTRDSTADTE